MADPIESWREIHTIPGYEPYVGYRVSDTGHVQTCKRRPSDGDGKRNWALSSSWKDMRSFRVGGKKAGYFVVTFSSPQHKTMTAPVSRLVLLAFGTEDRPTRADVLHRNGDLADCRLENLYWGPPRPADEDPARLQKFGRGEKHPNAILRESDVLDIYQRIADGAHPKEMASKYGVSHATVKSIITGESWRHLNLPALRPRERKNP